MQKAEKPIFRPAGQFDRHSAEQCVKLLNEDDNSRSSERHDNYQGRHITEDELEAIKNSIVSIR